MLFDVPEPKSGVGAKFLLNFTSFAIKFLILMSPTRFNNYETTSFTPLQLVYSLQRTCLAMYASPCMAHTTCIEPVLNLYPAILYDGLFKEINDFTNFK